MLKLFTFCIDTCSNPYLEHKNKLLDLHGARLLGHPLLYFNRRNAYFWLEILCVCFWLAIINFIQF